MKERFPFNRQDSAPVAGLCPPIYIVSPDAPMTGFCCSTTVWGTWTHWDTATKRSIACINDKKLCQGCLRQLPHRWKGFLHLYNPQFTREWFVELTPLADKSLKGATINQPSLRGLHLEFRREFRVKKSTILVACTGTWQGPGELPKPKEPEVSLARIFGLAERS